MFVFSDMLDWVAFGWFFLAWGGYTMYARAQARRTRSLSAILHLFREDWARGMMRREQRIADMALLGNLSQMANFLASTTILVLAGALTVLYSADNVMSLLQGHTFIAVTTKEQVQFKLLMLVLVFVFAFFRLTWCMRQHTFCSIMIGAAPIARGDALTPDENEFASYLGKISDRAGHEFNYGLRAYYFALSVLTWFVSPIAFMVSCTLVVWVLYRREFRSATLKYLSMGHDCLMRIEETQRNPAPPMPHVVKAANKV